MKIRKHCVFGTSGLDCGPAALTTVALHYGLTISLQKVVGLVESDLLGTSLEQLAKAAETLGFETRIGIVKSDMFASLPLPVIVRIQDPPLGHYVVVHRIKRDHVLLADPAEGLRKMSLSRFLKVWDPQYALLLRPTGTFDSGARLYSHLTEFCRLFLAFPQKALFALLLAFISMTLGFFSPYFVKLIIDTVIPTGNIRLLHLLGSAVVAVMLARAISSFTRQHVLDALGRSLELSIVEQYLKAILYLPLRFFAHRFVGDLFNRVNDAGIVRQAIGSTALSLIIDMCFLLGSSVFLLRQGLLPTLLVFLCVPLLLLLSIATSSSSISHQRASQFLQAKALSVIIDVLSNIRAIKSNGAEKKSFQRMTKAFSMSQMRIAKRDQHSNIINSLSTLFTTLCSAILLWVGTELVISGQLTVGRLMFFAAMLGIVVSVADRLVPSFVMLQTAFASYERIHEIMVEPSDTSGSYQLASRNLSMSCIEFNNVSFEYRKGLRVLKGISLKVATGQFVVIVGKTGCGKSTLAHLLAGLDVPGAGSILIEDIDISEIDKASLRRHIGIVFQDAGLLDMTIRENITLNDESVSAEEVRSATDQAMATPFIMDLPYQFDSPVGFSGLTLSSGQRQRIAIARALARSPKILILDEATSNLDPETELKLLQGLRANNGRTIILITHRLTNAMSADRIIVMEEGEIVEDGDHKSLLHSGGAYSASWAAYNRVSVPSECV